MLTLLLIGAGLALAAGVEVVSARRRRAAGRLSIDEIRRRYAAGEAGLRPEQLDPDDLRRGVQRSRPWGPFFPAFPLWFGGALLIAFVALQVADAEQAEIGFAVPVGFAIVVSMTIPDRKFSVPVSVLLLAGVATLVDPQRIVAETPATVESLTRMANGELPGVGPDGMPQGRTDTEIAMLWAGWIALAAFSGWAGPKALFTAPGSSGRMGRSAVAQLPVIAVLIYWALENSLAGVIATAFVLVWLELTLTTVADQWARDIARQAGWWGMTPEFQPLVTAPGRGAVGPGDT